MQFFTSFFFSPLSAIYSNCCVFVFWTPLRYCYLNVKNRCYHSQIFITIEMFFFSFSFYFSCFYFGCAANEKHVNVSSSHSSSFRSSCLYWYMIQARLYPSTNSCTTFDSRNQPKCTNACTESAIYSIKNHLEIVFGCGFIQRLLSLSLLFVRGKHFQVLFRNTFGKL